MNLDNARYDDLLKNEIGIKKVADVFDSQQAGRLAPGSRYTPYRRVATGLHGSACCRKQRAAVWPFMFRMSCMFNSTQFKAHTAARKLDAIIHITR